MKKLCLAMGLAGIMATPSLFAAMSVTLVDSSGNSAGSTYSFGNGGEFRAVGDAGLNASVNWNAYSSKTSGTTSDAIDGGSWGYGSGLALAGQRYFQTFCIESTAEFTPGGTYGASISYNALYGHAGASPGVPVTMGTAWLYSQFASGALAAYGYNYTYGAGRSTSAGDLQQAIWYLQGEGGSDNAWVTLAAGHVTDVSAAANGAFGVKALNLGDPGRVQDQLVIAPVPEPTTMIAGAGALGLALLGIGRVRRSSMVRVG